jgi:ATP-dependent RNA helicase HelY
VSTIGLSADAESFFEAQPFAPDRFQRDAVAAFERGESVVVTAPTGAGKTLVAEAAVHLTINRGKRAFYTAPIKALSNQKYGDFVAVYGPDRVGLLTGDNVINGEAPLVVMTTEVLRNMIYAESSALDRLGIVVLDEVHFLQDRYRGSVWEEIIIHLPRDIPLVNLSATVANATEFTDWVASRRGPTSLVVERHRPVPLESLYLLKDRHREFRLELFPVFGSGRERPNPQVVKLLRRGRGRFRRFASPRRLEVAETLQRERLLPAIYFIFSRAGCDQAADLVAAAGLGLTTDDERRTIRATAEAMTSHLAHADLDVLGYESWLGNLEQGVAAHHAGMVPAFKETVEELFAAGLIRIVFATETLALGINMPARTVVLERLSKFTGESHEILQAGDYTQLTGRAGRRGIDVEGTAVVLHSNDLPFERVAAIAAEGSHPLVSSFQPTYNMAVNLVANYDRERAEELLNASFAQFHAAQRRAALEESLHDREAELDEYLQAAACERGDLWNYLESTGGKGHDHVVAMRDFVQRTHEGDVLQLSAAADDRWVLVARSWGASPRLLMVGTDGETRRFAPEDLPPTLSIVGSLPLPQPVRSRDGAYQGGVARQLRAWEPSDAAESIDFADDVGSDPVATCPRLAEHLGWVRRAEKVDRDVRRLKRRLGRGDETLVGRFRAVLTLLQQWGYTRGWNLTEKGNRLRFVYNELDLLLTESVAEGLFADLDGPEVAALASMFTYQARAVGPEGGWPTAATAARGEALLDLSLRLAAAEHDHGLPETRTPDPGFAAVAHAWVLGVDLEELFDDDDMAAGDFVRNCRQLLDLLRQLRDTFPSLAPAARRAIAGTDRGVVAAGGRW